MKKILLLLSVVLCAEVASAQVSVGGGTVSGSLESNSVWYMQDDGVPNSLNPENRFASNNYLKVDFGLGNFSAGIQVEAYLPALIGYDMAKYGTAGKDFVLGSKYVQWMDDNFSVYVGNIYDQFGNGIIFRSYEDRALGFNNSLEGVRATYDFGGSFAVKALYGRPRLYNEYADSWVRGVDLSLSLSNLAGWYDGMFSVEGSYVNRYENLATGGYSEVEGANPNLDMNSARMIFDYSGFALNAEYVVKATDDFYSTSKTPAKGKAIFGQVGYAVGSFSFDATYRYEEHMTVLSTVYGEGSGNVLNYMPSLSRQYPYMLTNLNPNVVNSSGESALQADVYYSLRSKTNRRKWWNFHANFSTAYNLASTTGTGQNEMVWLDFNFDIERQWSKEWKTTFLYSRQLQTPVAGLYMEGHMFANNIFVGDITHKFNTKSALRLELQYLLADEYVGMYEAEDEGDWMAALAEYTFAPSWSIYVSDMYNQGQSEIHYYNVGFRYSKNRTAVQLSYGRNREGYVCSGGVCRYQPGYTGVGFSIISSF